MVINTEEMDVKRRIIKRLEILTKGKNSIEMKKITAIILCIASLIYYNLGNAQKNKRQEKNNHWYDR